MVRFDFSVKSRSLPTLTRPELNHEYHPLLTVSLISKTGEQANLKNVYIDTGAQWCLFNNDIAPRLGIHNFKNTEHTNSITGIGGKVENMAFFYDIKLVVYKNAKKPELDNAWEIDTRVGFLEKPIGFAGILGVYGFLDQFMFKSVIPKGYFEIEPLYQD